ncbi:LysR family transcriptional regulator [Paenibacillus shunpengii]|uniref:LysR family transcriptional regulator n=2 Tax=Paenibacillus TaxID=44249 RepID=A0AAX3N8G2_9BACL|nr:MULTISPECIES: LysR family transcriptional regulator [Paenibacillus]OMC65421.1 LysR family transcriptional regulator [Paenibacillus sp. FSL H7-0326]WDH84989.1 LysR family transcriptional regulator [Paenibacillus urinalis]SDX19402.1 LysR family transcriptional regulator, transcription activator of glutamate synthase operon [Paenibacillus sp. PDC88]
MEIRQMRYFIEVARREHVTDAANALHVAQSSVSRQIVQLESELGVDLFIRKGRRVKLTPIGKILLARVEQVMNMIGEAEREVKEYLDPEKGVVRIAFPISLAAHVLPTVIYAFRQRYPEARFQMRQALYRDLIDGVINGEFNLAMIAPLPSEDTQIRSKLLFTERIVALLPLQHRLADRAAIQLSEMQDDAFVTLPEGTIFREIVLQACSEIGFTPHIAFEGDDIDALKGLVSAGLGVALMPEVTLVDSIPHSTVKIPLVEPEVTRTIGVIIPTQRKLLPTEQLFYQFLSEFFASDGE